MLNDTDWDKEISQAIEYYIFQEDIAKKLILQSLNDEKILKFAVELHKRGHYRQASALAEAAGDYYAKEYRHAK